jgi:hypothetical protein
MKWNWNALDSILRADNARLIKQAMDARRRALCLGPSVERDWLIRQARYCEAAAHGVDWATSKGLQPPR